MVIHQWTARFQEWTYCAWEAPYVALETGAPKAATLGIFGILWVTDFNEHQWTWMITYGVAYGVAIPNQANQAVGIVGAMFHLLSLGILVPKIWTLHGGLIFLGFHHAAVIWVMATWSWTFHLRLQARNGWDVEVGDGFQTLGCSTEFPLWRQGLAAD